MILVTAHMVNRYQQAFAEYTGKRRRIEAREAREAARKAREDFEVHNIRHSIFSRIKD